jgi:hypothetical protein
MFQERRATRINVETNDGWVPVEKWEPRTLAFEHRLHLEVKKRRKG